MGTLRAAFGSLCTKIAQPPLDNKTIADDVGDGCERRLILRRVGCGMGSTGNRRTPGASLAVCSKAFMKHHGTAGLAFPEWQRKKVLLRNAVNRQVRETLELEALVLASISNDQA